MKTIFVALLLCISSFLYAQPNTTKVIETDEAYIIVIQSTNDLDSAETYISKAFDATPIIAWFYSGEATHYTGRDTTVNNYRHSNVIYPTVIYNGSGTDSLSLLELQGKGADGTWTTFDTLATKGATPIQSPIYLFAGTPFYSEWRIKATVADLTVSSYDATLWVEFIIPKRAKGVK